MGRVIGRVIDGYVFVLKVAMVACLAGMLVLVFGNVVLRYGFNSGITVSEEVSRLLFVWMTFMGAVVALHRQGHLGMDSLVAVLPRMGRLVCFVASHLLMVYATWLLLSGSWDQTLINLDVTAPATGISMGFFYGSGVMFGVLALVILVTNLVRAVAGRLTDNELIMVTESEETVENDAAPTGRHA
ncbi:TRAP transporter small permease [Azospirillum picis]|uniref:TRAP transporter small permease protein n=1 Tax=Azospirillum picis TaxID=488438 RepID=A0ABU0MVF0_9PROT|nr:TRAP transporter small permease [Azospirillum picis]MBP2299120.1 TRAP-type C4-dicarboxylate transport system permease small subunit [Azospirillum picis]MDQ0537046.1 TRAP-type C4-dicarboxylate transport system permease small subunit [Azospirillum picis]